MNNLHKLSLIALLAIPGFAQADLYNELKALEAKVAQHSSELGTIGTQINGLAGQSGSANITLNALKSGLTTQANELNNANARMSAVLAKTACFVAGPGHLRFEGVNVHVRNSAQPNAAPNGTGNIILGANTMPDNPIRTGSHNIVIGPYHSYEGMYNLVVGWRNHVRGNHNAIFAATESYSFVNSEHCVIGTGYQNRVGGDYSTLLTGALSGSNHGRSLMITGTSNNSIGDLGSAIITGESNTASDSAGLVITGKLNASYGLCSTVGTGQGGVLYSDYTWLPKK